MQKKSTKPFITYSEQLNNLIKKKHLDISNRSYAENKLLNIGYYSLIDGYKDIFYNPMTRTYEKGTNCEVFSENQAAYLNSANYNISKMNRYHISKLISKLTYEATKNTEHNYVVYQRNTYGNVPLWVIMKTLTMGQTSKMYSFMHPSIKSKISIHYDNITEKELIQYLRIFTIFRNLCAHNERLFSFQTRFEIPDTVLHKKLGIPQKGTQYLYGKHDVFALLIAFRYMLDTEDFIIFKRKLTQLFNTFTKATSQSQRDKLLKAMHFPPNWSSITRYKLC